MRAIVGLMLIVLWAVGLLLLHLVGFIHILLVMGIGLLVGHFIKRYRDSMSDSGHER